MSNLLVKHSRSLSPAKLLYRNYGGTPAATKCRPCCADESLSRNPLATRVATFGARPVSRYNRYGVPLSRRLESVLGRRTGKSVYVAASKI
jgi:hypothetical protein